MNSNTKILIIEDEPELRIGIEEMLQLEGFGVLSSENGNDGLLMANNAKPDIILCDIMMPMMDGFQVLEKWRGQQIDEDATAFIFITALNARNDFRMGMELGADDYLTKPFSRNELLAAIESKLKRLEKRKLYVQNTIAKTQKQLELKIETAKKEVQEKGIRIDEISIENEELRSLVNVQKEEIAKATLESIEVTNTISNIKAIIKRELSSCASENDRRILKKLNRSIGVKSMLVDNWAIFQMKFNQNYPNLISRISARYDSLTQYDFLLISSIISGLNNGQIAGLLNISDDSVRKGKYRLKKKLKLEKDQDLGAFLHTFNC